MHPVMLLCALGISIGIRYTWSESTGNWQTRWQQAIATFLVPPLLLLSTAIAILWMGPQGLPSHWIVDRISYSVAIGFLLLAGGVLLKLAIEAWQSLRQIRTYTPLKVNGSLGRLLLSPLPFIAQVGFWNPELVVSQGLLDQLDPSHLEAVAVHEQAHQYYRDTFWFFWLGWLCRLTWWLPYTEALWQELLLLRELRADRWAVQQVDNLLLAEALLLVVQSSIALPESFCAAFSCTAPPNRLAQRIDALLMSEGELRQGEPTPFLNQWLWLGFVATLVPFAAIPFHSLNHAHYCLLM